MAQLGAFVALMAILVSIVGTALIFIFSSWTWESEHASVPQVSEEQLQEYIDSLPETEVVPESPDNTEASDTETVE